MLATEALDDDGCPHTLEHLVFLGSEDYPYKGVLDRLANRALAQGTNAWTDIDHTCYTVRVPRKGRQGAPRRHANTRPGRALGLRSRRPDLHGSAPTNNARRASKAHTPMRTAPPCLPPPPVHPPPPPPRPARTAS